MQEDLYISLLYKKLSGTLQAAERQALEQWVAASPEHQKIARSVEKAWDLGGRYTSVVDVDLDDEFGRLQGRIQKEERPNATPKLRRIFPIWQMAAGILLLVAAGFLLRQYFPGGSEWQKIHFTERQTQAILLDDGSRMWANAGTTVRYPSSFDGEERRVRLDGEAFFDVKTDANHPFVIETPSGTVQVLGTRFNVNDYADADRMQVQVESGKVKVQVEETKEEMVLVKGQQSIYDKSTRAFQQGADEEVANRMAWHTRVFRFSNKPLAQTVQIIGMVYGKAIEIEDAEMDGCPVTLRLNKLSIEQVLQNITSVYGMTISEHPDHYLLKGGTCKND